MPNGTLQQAEELEAARARYFELYDQAPVGYMIINEQGLILETNCTAAALLGLDRAALVDQPFTRFILPEDRDGYYQRRRTLFETGAPQVCEMRLERTDGAVFWAHLAGRAAWDGDGAPVCRFMMSDVTERRQAEEALKRANSLLDAALESTADGLLVVTPEGKAVRFNRKFLELWRIPEDLAVQRDDRALIRFVLDRVKAPEAFLEKVKEIYRSPEACSFDELELRDGRVFERLSQPQRLDGRIVGRVWSFRDITDRKQAEEGLKEQRRLQETILDSVPTPVFYKDTQGRYLGCNRAFLNLFGLSRERVIGKNVFEAMPPEVARTFYQADQDLFRKGGTQVYETRIPYTDGLIHDIVFHKAVFPDKAGVAAGIVGVIIDVTERKRMEAEKKSLEERLQRAEKMEALGTLAGGVAHDLNNFLGIIVGYAELLLFDVDRSSPLRPGLVNILSGSQKAAAIVQDLLTLARRGISDRRALHLNQIIVDSRNSPEFENLCAYHAGVEIKFDLEPELLNIAGSPVHLGKAFFNLISNASEAMPQGGTLIVKTSNQYLDRPIQGYDEVREGDYVVLSVSDTGEGIQAGDLKRIFEPFYTKKVMGRSGTGLGLAVVWGTVKDHHGYIDVQSEEGRGSTFTLYFPVTRETLYREPASVPIAEYLGKGEAILVVDDVPGQREMAAEMLRKLNYTVTSAASGEEALAYLGDHRVDLLVLDMIMDPGLDGLETYRKILEIHPRQKAIIVSGFSESHRVHAAQVLGAGAYVKKPYVLEKLGLAVRKELDRVA